MYNLVTLILVVPAWLNWPILVFLSKTKDQSDWFQGPESSCHWPEVVLAQNWCIGNIYGPLTRHGRKRNEVQFIYFNFGREQWINWPILVFLSKTKDQIEWFQYPRWLSTPKTWETAIFGFIFALLMQLAEFEGKKAANWKIWPKSKKAVPATGLINYFYNVFSPHLGPGALGAPAGLIFWNPVSYFSSPKVTIL